MINTTLALRSTKYLSKERDYTPWESALGNLQYFILMFDRTEVYGALEVILKPTLLIITGEEYRSTHINVCLTDLISPSFQLRHISENRSNHFLNTSGHLQPTGRGYRQDTLTSNYNWTS